MYPEIFRVGGFTLHSFGVMMALAFISAGFVAHWQFKRRGVRPDFIYGLLIAAVLGACWEPRATLIPSDEWRATVSGGAVGGGSATFRWSSSTAPDKGWQAVMTRAHRRAIVTRWDAGCST